jgi:hypothetical protein
MSLWGNLIPQKRPLHYLIGSSMHTNIPDNDDDDDDDNDDYDNDNDDDCYYDDNTDDNDDDDDDSNYDNDDDDCDNDDCDNDDNDEDDNDEDDNDNNDDDDCNNNDDYDDDNDNDDNDLLLGCEPLLDPFHIGRDKGRLNIGHHPPYRHPGDEVFTKHLTYVHAFDDDVRACM